MSTKTTDDFSHLPEVMHFVLASAGIPRHEHAKALSKVIGVSVTQAYKKLNGRSDMTLPQIDLFNLAYGVHIVSTVAQPRANQAHEGESTLIADAFFSMGKFEVSCSVFVGPVLREGYQKRYASYRSAKIWYVQDVTECPANATLYEVDKISINLSSISPTATTLAVVDDERGTADNLRDYLAAKGYTAYAFYNLKSARSAIELKPFDGYFLDWRLAEGTSEKLIKHIRKIQPGAPIIVSTAGAADGQDGQVTLASMVEQYGVACHAKPMALKVLTSLMAQAIEASNG